MMPHAHRLIKKYGKDEVDDPHDMVVGEEEGYVAAFHSMGIIHTAKKNIVSELVKKKTELKKEQVARVENKIRELTKREEMEIKQDAENESKCINLNIVRLKFEAFIKLNGILHPICEPVLSHGINNLKSALTGELKIVRMDHCTSPAKGNREIFILVERVTKKNVKIRFTELDDEDQVIWEDYGRFSDLDVHHQYAIVFKTPAYKDVNITSKVKVNIELIRPSDGARSEPKEFTYVPCDNIYRPGKRARTSCSASNSYSYDSSNLPSNELPAVLNTGVNSWENPVLLNSRELENVRDEINSEDFNRVYEWAMTHMDNDIYNQAPEGLASQDICTDGVALSNMYNGLSIVKMEISTSEKNKALDAYNEIQNFIKTKPSVERIKGLLHHYFGNEGESNPLHIFILENNHNYGIYIIRLICQFKECELFNRTDSHGQTALHLSVMCNNLVFTKMLLDFMLDPSVEDHHQNTPLHVACKNKAAIEILELLIKFCRKNIDATNNNGDTPLILAIEQKYLPAIKLLLQNGANINKQHNNNGFTPLRFAIEKDYLEGVRYILGHEKLVVTLQKDFSGMNALQAALLNNSTDQEIIKEVRNYLTCNKINFEIKEEDYESDEMEIDFDDKAEVKEEINESELEIMYNKVKYFTPSALDQVATLIDSGGTCDYLAELLELDHLIRCGILKVNESVSKSLLKYAVEKNRDSLWVIRNFLQSLEQPAAVSVMDDMVRECYNRI